MDTKEWEGRRAADVAVGDVEQLLYLEASLLDSWQLERWLDLLTEDVEYIIPSLDRPPGNLKTTVFVIHDTSARVRTRVRQLLDGWVLSESPPSRTRRFISNVRIERLLDDRSLEISANFVIHRFKHEQTSTLVGAYGHQLVVTASGLKIRRRLTTLDNEAFRPQGSLTLIV